MLNFSRQTKCHIGQLYIIFNASSIWASSWENLFLARLYLSTGRDIAVATVSASPSASVLLKMLKFLVKVFKRLYLLNPWMDLVDTLPDDRYGKFFFSSNS